MKMNKKLRRILLTVCSAALLVCVTVGATVAYLTSTDEVNNTFTVGSVDITLDEAAIKQDETTKNWVEDADADRVDGNKYHLLPGITYAKDPTVTVTKGSEKAYVRVLVTVNKKTALDSIFAKYAESEGLSIDDVVIDFSDEWKAEKDTIIDTEKDTRTYVIRYIGKDKDGNGTVEDSEGIVDAQSAAVKLADVFQKISIPEYFTNDDIKDLNGLTINVVAQAIQADGFDTGDAAWAAFDGE